MTQDCSLYKLYWGSRPSGIRASLERAFAVWLMGGPEGNNGTFSSRNIRKHIITLTIDSLKGKERAVLLQSGEKRGFWLTKFQWDGVGQAISCDLSWPGLGMWQDLKISIQGVQHSVLSFELCQKREWEMSESRKTTGVGTQQWSTSLYLGGRGN